MFEENKKINEEILREFKKFWSKFEVNLMKISEILRKTQEILRKLSNWEEFFWNWKEFWSKFWNLDESFEIKMKIKKK